MGLLDELRGGHVYLDANIFIYALNGFPAYAPALKSMFEGIEAGVVSAATSELTLAELLIIPFRHGNIEEENRCRLILSPRPNLSVLPVSSDVLVSMARLRAALPTIRTPDAIHAATAQLADCDTFMTNDRHLKAIAGLRLILLSDLTAGEQTHADSG